MKGSILVKAFIVGVLIVFFASCDRDINEIGSNIVGDDHFGLNVAQFDVNAYNQDLGPVQTNDLSLNQFGYYNNPVFGKTKASFVSQVALAVTNPTFYTPVIDSVYLYVPYFSTFQSTDTDSGDSTYKLDSIQGSGKIKLSIYESTKMLEDYDASTGFQQPQKYYSNQKSVFDTYHSANRLNNDNSNVYDHTVTAPDYSQNDQFVFSPKQIKFYKNGSDGNPDYTNVRTRLAPGLFVNLDKTFFTSKIMQAPSGKLFNNNVFKEYFRGLYFNVEEASGSESQGTLAMMNFSRGVITIVYKDQVSSTDTTITRKEMTINLSGHSVNLLENDNTYPGYVTPNPTQGDNRLFLKGGNGSMAVIDLFNGEKNSNNADLNKMRNENWMINEANLTFSIDKDAMTGAPEPNRVYLYDLTNRRPLIDLYTDISTSASTSKFNKQIFGGILMDDNEKIVNKANGERGTKYKIRITNYLRMLVKNGLNTDPLKDSTNVRLGLVITENISNSANVYLQSPFSTNSPAPLNGTGTQLSKYIPQMSVINPLGTILYGSNPSVPSNKRLKLEIYYTKPN
ncbi:DUF4270 domain-containing protein [Flavobacterium aciduliphilum]|uniref:Uncharacterized protein DUF4270 n=1 Tax=Flavobacterium aciduliphilum TaxID=1101402 RepID=A0A328YF02_9FLAO|nr:DUF4270 domain-containing protein [Flavobacterium aciduliphilum]RAR72578.1 uncharacterized protein DUF4270 [Flavobacterium aciduliphilum]